MEEKRRSKRLPVDLFLEVSSIFKQDNYEVLDVDAPIEVTDVSKSGIGFRSKSKLPVGYYFNAKLQLGNSESILYCVVRIVRSYTTEEGMNMYGCEFAGMPPILYYIFDEYEEYINKQK